jgi:hypothetical protein
MVHIVTTRLYKVKILSSAVKPTTFTHSFHFPVALPNLLYTRPKPHEKQTSVQKKPADDTDVTR